MWHNRNYLLLIALIVNCFDTHANSHIDGEKSQKNAQTASNTFEIIMKQVERFSKNKLVASITNSLGPIGSIIGTVGNIMKVFTEEPDIKDYFAEQTAFINESFIAMTNQVIF